MPVNCLLSKGVKWPWNNIWSWFKVKVKAESCVKSLFRLLVYLICCSCFTQRVFIVSVQWPWTNYLGTCLRLGSWRKIFVLQIVFSLPWSSFGFDFTERAHLVNWYARPWRINIQRSKVNVVSGKKNSSESYTCIII